MLLYTTVNTKIRSIHMLKYFFYTQETIPEGMGWEHYSLSHLLWIASSVIAMIIICRHYNRLDKESRMSFRKKFAWSIVAVEVMKAIVIGSVGRYTVDYLPLHLCSINVFVILYHAYRPNEVVGQSLYALCLPGAIVALLFPMWNPLPNFTYMNIHSFVTHTQLSAYALMLLTSKELVPSMKLLPKCALMILSVTPFIYIFNLIFGTNFMFINEPQVNSPLEILGDLMGNPGYLIGFAALIAVVWFFMFLPWEIAAKKKKNS